MIKPTVHDIAKEAGVSLATVDRVLNARKGVREATIAKVNAAVDRLGYVRDTYAANLARQRLYRLAFVLPQGRSQFALAIKAALKETYASPLGDRTMLRIVEVPPHDPHAIVRTLERLHATHLDGVAIMVPETPQVRDAVARLKDAGLAVVTVVSDLPNSQRDHFVGINSVAAGRTAGQLMGRFVHRPGDILVVSNSMGSRDSLERRLGFDAVMRESFPHLVPLPSVEAYDDRDRMERIIAAVCHGRPQLAGVYSMGSGNTALLNALRRTGQLPRLTVIAHELTPAMHQALIDDDVAAVIAQNVGHLARSALRTLKGLCDGQPIFEAQERVRIDVIVRENLP
ncbi:MAG: LacI family DNA-binding transcriptional regulator [Pseudomonadota bacterium]